DTPPDHLFSERLSIGADRTLRRTIGADTTLGS
ncbi:hypothetical protein A2U01_0076427, partial [Trifolium medium]|nr:hypothetical protein [Trifolium medium]